MVQYEPVIFNVDTYLVTTKEQLYRKIATLTDQQLEAWAQEISILPAPNEGRANFRMRVIDILEQSGQSMESDINKGIRLREI